MWLRAAGIARMSKVMPCNEVVSGCPFIARGETDDDVLNCAEEHAREIHGMQRPSKEFMKKARAAIREEKC